MSAVKLATIRLGTRTTAARIEEDAGEAVEVSAADVGALLAQTDWAQIAAAAAGTRHSLAEVDYAPVVPKPGKIICVGPQLSCPYRRARPRATSLSERVRQIFLGPGRGARRDPPTPNF